jgi:hypothetical protein
MRSKKRNLNIKILQNQIKNIALDEANELPIKDKNTGSGIIQAPRELPVIEKIKKKGIPKNELISTKRLLTM